MEDERKVNIWYNNASLITTIIICVLSILIVLSESFAVQNRVSAVSIIRSLLNHNSAYLVYLVYFILLKFSVGKKNFNLLNIIFISFNILITVFSLFTILTSFTISSILGFCLNFIILIYMIYAFLEGTRLWDEFRLSMVPFDEVENDWYFYGISGLSIFILFINLINTGSFYGVVIAMLEAVYVMLFARYIYLYKVHEDSKKIKKSKKRK